MQNNSLHNLILIYTHLQYFLPVVEPQLETYSDGPPGQDPGMFSGGPEGTGHQGRRCGPPTGLYALRPRRGGRGVALENSRF